MNGTSINSNGRRQVSMHHQNRKTQRRGKEGKGREREGRGGEGRGGEGRRREGKGGEGRRREGKGGERREGREGERRGEKRKKRIHSGLGGGTDAVPHEEGVPRERVADHPVICSSIVPCYLPFSSLFFRWRGEREGEQRGEGKGRGGRERGNGGREGRMITSEIRGVVERDGEELPALEICLYSVSRNKREGRGECRGVEERRYLANTKLECLEGGINETERHQISTSIAITAYIKEIKV